MRSGWLLRDGDVLCAAERADTFAERSKGLLGRSAYEGAMLFPHTRSVHTAGMRFAVDVAFLDRHLVVISIVQLPRWRIALPRWHGRLVLEAAAGSFERWSLSLGDMLEFREAG